MNNTYKVYTHTCPDGMVYVGVTSQNLNKRWNPSGYKGITIEPYINEYGWENITHQVIYTTPDRDEAYQIEDEMINYYRDKGCCINKQRSGLIRVKDEKAYDRQWKRNYRKEHPEYRKEYNERSRQYNEDHKEERNAYKRQFRKNNPEYRKRQNELCRQWRAKKKAEKMLQSGQLDIPLAS